MTKIYREEIYMYINMFSYHLVDINIYMFTTHVTSFLYYTTGSVDLHPGRIEYYVAEI